LRRSRWSTPASRTRCLAPRCRLVALRC
jgi:hypothetical protein